MTQEEIKEVVKQTIDELIQRKIIKNEYEIILAEVEPKLKLFFDNKGDGLNIGYALKQVLDDPYIDIIFLQYRDGKTLEWIAEHMNVETRTILRNKKRLITKVYELLEGV